MKSALVILPLALIAGFAGCNSSDAPSGESADSRSPQTAPALRADPQICRDLLDRSIDMLQPTRLGITAERKTAAGSLNDWAVQCAGADFREPDQLPEEATGLVTDETRERMQEAHYSGRDADSIRNAFLFQQILDSQTAGRASDLERVVDVFYHVVRSLERVERQPDDPPLTPYEILLFGKGTAEDQAWIFAELLRQMQLDVIILRPSTSGGSAGADDPPREPVLTAVLLDGKLYLFDFRLGLPIPAPEAGGPSLLVERPATLDQAVADPGVLGSLHLDGENAYPIDAAALAKPGVELIGHSSVWSLRMKRLQTALSGEQSAVIYDPFWSDGSNAGAVARVASAGGDRWTAADITLWPYPETQLAAFEQLDEQRPQEIHRWLRAPFPIVQIDQTGQPGYGAPQNDLLKARIDHLLGDLTSVVVRYTGLRGLERSLVMGVDPQTRQTLVISERDRTILQQRVPAAIRQLHRLAAEDAHYWLGLAQYEQGQYAAAAGTLTSYLDAHGAGSWAAAARELRAFCFAHEDRMADAIADLRTLLDAEPDDRSRLGIELMIRRWEGLAEGASPADPPANR